MISDEAIQETKDVSDLQYQQRRRDEAKEEFDVWYVGLIHICKELFQINVLQETREALFQKWIEMEEVE